MALDLVASLPRIEFVGRVHSELVHHGTCCDAAQTWLRAMHRSWSFRASSKSSGRVPVWLKHHYHWGAVQWPISWCEAVRSRAIDCGVFAAFARYIMQHEYHAAFPAQILLQQPKTYTKQWQQKWADVRQMSNWIGGDHVYHEVCAVQEEEHGEVRIYDPTEGWWIAPEFSEGINGLQGICVMSDEILNWGSQQVGQGQWLLASKL